MVAPSRLERDRVRLNLFCPALHAGDDLKVVGLERNLA